MQHIRSDADHEVHRLHRRVRQHEDAHRQDTRREERHDFLAAEMHRAARLVVDTGIHAMGWTRAQAEAFMREHTALTAINISNEVDRYISWPGQALAYKIGQLKIRELRTAATRGPELRARAT